MMRGTMGGLGAVRLHVLNALPLRHQSYFFEEVRKLCAKYVARSGIPAPNRETEALELVSEVMAKLLSGRGDESGDNSLLAPTLAADNEPACDGRVIWLISQIGGRLALAQRSEDMRRGRFGRKPGGGYRTEQLDDSHVNQLVSDPDEPLDEEDNRKVWLGVRIAARSEFKPSEDVARLLDLMANNPDIQAGFDGGWPVSSIVKALNQLHPNPPWNDDRVENAKKRLKSWISRLGRDSGLDSTDLMALFARYAIVQNPE
jgi:hypothetical protein